MRSVSYATWTAPPQRISREAARPRVLPPHLELLAPLGMGGMGAVWRARDHRRGCQVALKAVQIHSASSISNLKREFRMAQEVVHPNLVALYELYAQPQQAFFTMELVDGEPLAARHADPEALRRHIGTLGAALHQLHRTGLVHGDVKSSNVLIESGGREVLLDLGLARRDGEALPMRLDGEGPVGTPGYLAPELFAAAPVSPATDAYALGVLLYRALTRQEPTRGDMATRRWLAEGTWFPAPVEVRTGLPGDLSALAMALLRPDPTQRATLEDVAVVSQAPVTSASFWVDRPVPQARLREGWSAAQTAGASVLVSGPGGIGKSSLVRREVDQLGVPVCWGRASPVEHVPYQALDSVLDMLWDLPCLAHAPEDALAHAERLFRRLEPADEVPLTAGEAAAGVRGLGRLLQHVGSEQGLVVVIDDVQWADSDSLRVLSSLLHAPRSGCLVILISRLEGIGTVRGLFRETLPVHISLGPLPIASVSSTLGRALSSLELSSLAHDDGVVPAALTLLRSSGDSALDLRARLEVRLADLALVERDTLVCCCLTARPLTPQVLASLGGSEAGARALVAEGLLAVRNDLTGDATLVPVHDLVREQVVQRSGDLRAHHQQLGALFARGGPSAAAACAHHFTHAGAEQEAVVALQTAARYALDQGAFDWSARLFAQAESMGGSALEFAEARGMALASARRHPEAISVWLAAASDSQGLSRIRLLSHAIDLLMGGGHLDQGLAAMKSLMDEAGERLPAGRWSVLAFGWNTLHAALTTRRPGPMQPSDEQAVKLEALWTAANSLTPFAPVAGQSIHARHRALSFSFGDARHRAQALGSQLLFRRGQGWSVEREMRALRDLLLWVPDSVRGYVWGCRGYGLRLGCDFSTSVEELHRSLVYFGDQRQRFWYSRFGQVALLLNDAYHAPLSTLARQVEAIMEDAIARDDRAARAGLDLSLTWLIHLLREDDPAGAWAVLEALPETWGRALQPEQVLRLSIAQVQLLLYERRLDEAARLLDHPPSAVKRLWRFRLLPFYWHLCRGRLALMRGEERVVQQRIRALEALKEPVALGAAGLLAIGLSRRRGEVVVGIDAARTRLAAQRHTLLAHALSDAPLSALAAHGVKNPQRTLAWITGLAEAG